jgi:23S rRNA pseudouridine1911/1915/1917 synthase
MSNTESSADTLRVVIGPNPPERIDKALARDVPEGLGLSRSRLTKLIAEGLVRQNGTVLTSPKGAAREGDVIEILFVPPAETELLPEAIPLDVVWEDDDLIVINKPAGMVVHPAPGSPSGTLVNALMHHCGDSLSGIGGEKRPGIVHRIDKETSGLLVAAKTDLAHQGLAKQFEAHSVSRQYRALVHGVPSQADPRLSGVRGVSFEPGGAICIRAAIARHRTDRQRMAVTESGGRHAVTRVRVDEVFGAPAGLALVTCWLETGRTHQIRVHLAHVGHGLVGDQVYGGRRKISAKAFSGQVITAIEAFPRQALHAALLGFDHPGTGSRLEFEAHWPEDMDALVGALRSP